MITTNNDNKTILNNNHHPKAEPEVIDLLSEMTDLVESHHENGNATAGTDTGNGDFGTLVYNKNKQTVRIVNGGEHSSEENGFQENGNGTDDQPEEETESDPQNNDNNNHHQQSPLSSQNPQNPKNIPLMADDYNQSDMMSIAELEQFAENFLSTGYNPKVKKEPCKQLHLKNNNIPDSGKNSSPESAAKKPPESSPSYCRQNSVPLGNSLNEEPLLASLSMNSSTSDINGQEAKGQLDDSFDESAYMGQVFHNEAPVAILIAQPGSCSFIDRKIRVCTAIKIGRAVARMRPAPDNAVFDCKVLSRNHAMLHFQDGKFFLRDAGSSNGTFINSVRLSNTSKKSKPHEIFSGDVLQFGVEVTEKKQVHNCVIAEVKLYLPDGGEAKKPYSDSVAANFAEENGFSGAESVIDAMLPVSGPASGFYMSTSQMIELSHFIKESMHKQSLLENQLESIKNLMEQARNSASQKWNSVVNEDVLLGRIEILQDKIVALTVSQNIKDPQMGEFTLEHLSKELHDAINEKEQFEVKTKAILQNLIEEKAVLIESVNSFEKAISSKELECDNLKDMLEMNYKQMQDLAALSEVTKKETAALHAKVEQLEKAVGEQQEKEAKLEAEKVELCERIECLEKETEVKTAEQQTDSSHNEQANDGFDLSSLQAFITSQQNLEPSKQTLKLQERLLAFCDRLTGVENRIAGLKATITERQSRDKELLESLKTELDAKTRSLETATAETRELNDRNDRLSHEIQKYKIDFETLQTQKLDDDDKIRRMEEEITGLKVAVVQKEEEIKAQESLIEQPTDEIDAAKSSPDLSASLGDIKESPSEEEKDVSEEEKDVSEAEKAEREEKYADIAAIWPQLEEVLGTLTATSDSVEKQISDKQDVVHQLRKVLNNNRDLSHENHSLAQEVEATKTKLRELSDKNELSFLFAIVPLFFFVIALVLGFYPFLSSIMATSGV